MQIHNFFKNSGFKISYMSNKCHFFESSIEIFPKEKLDTVRERGFVYTIKSYNFHGGAFELEKLLPVHNVKAKDKITVFSITNDVHNQIYLSYSTVGGLSFFEMYKNDDVEQMKSFELQLEKIFEYF